MTADRGLDDAGQDVRRAALAGVLERGREAGAHGIGGDRVAGLVGDFGQGSDDFVDDADAASGLAGSGHVLSFMKGVDGRIIPHLRGGIQQLTSTSPICNFDNTYSLPE